MMILDVHKFMSLKNDVAVMDIFGKVKSDLEYRAGSAISNTITNKVKKGFEKGNKCPKCKKPINDATLKFCPNCGTKLSITCLKCNTDFLAGTKFCTQCGEALT